MMEDLFIYLYVSSMAVTQFTKYVVPLPGVGFLNLLACEFHDCNPDHQVCATSTYTHRASHWPNKQ